MVLGYLNQTHLLGGTLPIDGAVPDPAQMDDPARAQQMQGALDDALRFPVAPVVSQVNAPVARELVEVGVDFRQLSQDEIAVNHATPNHRVRVFAFDWVQGDRGRHRF